MGGGLLSQDDINALLTGADFGEETPAAEPIAENNKAGLPTNKVSSYNLEYLNKVFNHFNEAGKSVLSTIIGTDIDCSLAAVEILDSSTAKQKLAGKKVILATNFNSGFSGDFNVYVDSVLGGVLADLMTGADGSAAPEELTELHESAINEAVNQMIASGLTSISGDLKKLSLSTDIPVVKIADVDESYEDKVLNSNEVIIADIRFNVLEYKDKPLFFVMPKSTADSINAKYAPVPQPEQPATAPVAPPVQVESAVAMQQQKTINQATSQKNMLMLLDIPLALSVNLGKTKMLMKDILNLGIGSIIELDKCSSEPVDLSINSKPIARGEVVVVDENFGLRVTELVSPYERLEIIKKEK